MQDLLGRGNELSLYFVCDGKLTALNRGVTGSELHLEKTGLLRGRWLSRKRKGQ